MAMHEIFLSFRVCNEKSRGFESDHLSKLRCFEKLLIEGSSEFRLLSPVRMNVVCFTFNQENPGTNEIATFLSKIRDDGRTFFTPTNYKGVPAIRAAFSNWQTTEADVTIAFQALKETY